MVGSKTESVLTTGSRLHLTVVHTGVSDTYGQQLIQDIADDLNSMTAGLIADWVSNEKETTGLCCSAAYFWVVVFEIW